MTNYGYLKLCAASPRIKLADPLANAEIIAAQAKDAAANGAGVILFPELCLTGCSCGDLFFSESLQEKTSLALSKLLADTAGVSSAIVLGLPLTLGGRLANCAAVLQNGKIMGIAPKSGIGPEERRWFAGSAFLCGISGI